MARAGYFPTISFSEAWQRGNQPVFVFGSLLSFTTHASAQVSAGDKTARPLVQSDAQFCTTDDDCGTRV